MNDKMAQQFEEAFKEQMEKRKKLLMRFPIPEDRSLLHALGMLTKAELDDMRYNLCVQGISQMKKQEMAAALAPQVEAFARRWLVTIGVEQYHILTELCKNGGVGSAVAEDDARMEYMRCMGIIFNGSRDGALAWYMPDEILAVYEKMDRVKFKKAVLFNDEVVRLATGLLFYYGYLPYDALYEKICAYVKEKLEFIDFMGILINAGYWQGSIVNVELGAHYYTVMDYEALSAQQIMRKDLDYYAFPYEWVYRAGEPGYIEETDEYKALVVFFMQEFSLSVLDAADIVGELFIILRNDEKFSEMIAYVQSVVEIPNQRARERLTELLAAFNHTSHLWSLKGRRPCELSPERKQAVAPHSIVRFVPRSSLVGRNDLCSCGSGKKYKKCCLNKEI